MSADARTYHVGIVGEASYQRAISLCREGERVTLFAEYGNPYDRDAVVVKCSRSQTIGYIGRSNWLRGVLLNEGQGCSATIATLREVDGKTAVVLRATLDRSTLRNCAYVAPR
ncbi:hypothetical protein [Sphingomonas sp. GC_Shp_3]|uniref:hypothetical protein n=1 Tax=Sphingomonas sp. GC_Shp_3 TaxID=2937383 RepID=UPI0022698712|nr:hypothetical protein [Sphingomonas sp. GC_Shp_3]